MTGPAVFRGVAVVLPGAAAAVLLPLVLEGIEARSRRDDTLPTSPALTAGMDALRAGTQAYWDERGAAGRSQRQEVPTSSDIAARSPRDLTDRQVADRLRCTPRNVVRLAERAGVQPVPGTSRPRLWAPDAVAAMTAVRSHTP